MISSQQLSAALAAIDKLNAQDPNSVTMNDISTPSELLYGQRMSQQLTQYKPDASAELQIAARAQHIQRWTFPRSDFPMDKAGYYQWRTQLGQFHADTTASLMTELNIAPASIEKVASLLRKEKLNTDPEMQILEDVICLVFLQYYFEPFAAKHDENKVINILKKTWRKMSEAGHNAALALSLPPHLLSLVKKALA